MSFSPLTADWPDMTDGDFRTSCDGLLVKLSRQPASVHRAAPLIQVAHPVPRGKRWSCEETVKQRLRWNAEILGKHTEPYQSISCSQRSQSQKSVEYPKVQMFM